MDDNYEIRIDIDPYEQDRIRISTPFPGRDKEKITQLPGCRFRKEEDQQYFLAPLSWPSCVAAVGIFGERLVIGEALNAWAWWENANRIQPSLALRNATEAEGDPDLYGYQRAAVRFLTFARRALLCDDMGLGKTVETIRALAELTRQGEQVFPALVVAPSSMVLTWKHEFMQWWEGLTIVAVPGGLGIKHRRDLIMTPAHVHIVSYETARSHSRLTGYGSKRLQRCIVCDKTLPSVNEEGQLINQQSRCQNCVKELNRHWQTMIVDEAHRLKDPSSAQTRAIWAMREGLGTKVEPAEFAFALTGTPIANYPDDLWPALRFVRPDEFQTREGFTERYCEWGFNTDRDGGLHPKVIGLHPDPARKAEFYSIINPIMRRMPKEAVLSQLPPRIYTTRYVQMPSKQKTAYERMEKDMIAELDGGIVVAMNPLAKLVRLGQFASAYATLINGEEVQLTDPSCKLDALMEILSDMTDKPVVVFAVHLQLIDLAVARLEKAKISYALITGAQSAVDQDLAKRDFQEGRKRVLLVTLGAGSEGLTFTRADTAIFLEQSWSELVNQQARDRIHRIGSEIHDRVEYIDIVAEGTIEERQRTVLELKEEQLEVIVRDRDVLALILKGIPERKAG
jgi:SNF2 family DNA or RNA helicase